MKCSVCESKHTHIQICGFWFCWHCEKRLDEIDFPVLRLWALSHMMPRPRDLEFLFH